MVSRGVDRELLGNFRVFEVGLCAPLVEKGLFLALQIEVKKAAGVDYFREFFLPDFSLGALGLGHREI